MVRYSIYQKRFGAEARKAKRREDNTILVFRSAKLEDVKDDAWSHSHVCQSIDESN